MSQTKIYREIRLFFKKHKYKNKIKMKYNYKFKHFFYNINNNIITKADIILAINELHAKYLQDVAPNVKIAVLFKIKSQEGEWRNVSSLQIIDVNRLEDLKEVFNLHWSSRSDHYHGMSVSKIVFRYRFIEPELSPNECLLQYPTDFDKSNVLLPHGYQNLPNDRLFEKWGDCITIINDTTFIVQKDSHTFSIKNLDNEYFVTMSYKDIEILNFHDVYDNNPENKNTFRRIIGNFNLYYNNGVCNFLKQEIRANYIKIKNPDFSTKENFLTMDLETRNINGEMHVITASIFDGTKTMSFYLQDYSSSDDLLKNAILYLLKRKYVGYRVYLHNFSNFDGIFMVRVMAQLSGCTIDRCILSDKNGKIIDIKLSTNLDGKRKHSIYFRDSLLILPSSLKKLGESFSVEIKKSIYPYKFVNNPEVNLDYEGVVPPFKDFEGISIEEYREYCKGFDNNENMWSLKNETVKYCENDVKSLYLILRQFQISIFRLFEADINKYPTLSSLAFAIYRMKYLKENKIPIITGEIYKNLQQSYTGGSVDVYKPVGKNVNRYDVNSLYPSVMSQFASPVGKIHKFNGDIYKHEENPFGFFYVNVKTPENIHIPILQTRVKTSNGGIRTVSPLGEWTGWYFSEEITNAIKHGYKFEVIGGYLFEKEFIFKEYVDDLYKLKKNSAKNSAFYTISKLLLNSLYGRFGMSPDRQSHCIIRGRDEIGKFITNKAINYLDSTELDTDIELISYTNNKEEESELSHNNISVAVSSSITAYARIIMSEIKTEYSDNIYYSDTDSIDLDVELPEKYISNDLGDFKFEKKFKDVIYIAPKVYAAITSEGEEYVVVKGFKENIKFDKIAKIINKSEKLVLNQEKWYKNISEGKILTKNESYTLMATENKRKLVYKDNKLVKSLPYKLVDGKLI